LADLPMAMTAHLVFAALDAERPATQSPTIIRAIREDIGFMGLLMSDDLNMQALAGTLADRTVRTIAAGVDIALHCKGDMGEMVEVAGVAGRMGPAALARAEAALAARRAATVSVEAALAELADG
jgi:beta-N-acetylhexosaminidase